MTNRVSLENYKRSLEVFDSTIGFEDEALGACVGLVQFGYATDTARMAWLKAAESAVVSNSANNIQANAMRFFYKSLLNKKTLTFGLGIYPLAVLAAFVAFQAEQGRARVDNARMKTRYADDRQSRDYDMH